VAQRQKLRHFALACATFGIGQAAVELVGRSRRSNATMRSHGDSRAWVVLGPNGSQRVVSQVRLEFSQDSATVAVRRKKPPPGFPVAVFRIDWLARRSRWFFSARLLLAERGHTPGSLLATVVAAETGPDQVRTDDLLPPHGLGYRFPRKPIENLHGKHTGFTGHRPPEPQLHLHQENEPKSVLRVLRASAVKLLSGTKDKRVGGNPLHQSSPSRQRAKTAAP